MYIQFYEYGPRGSENAVRTLKFVNNENDCNVLKLMNDTYTSFTNFDNKDLYPKVGNNYDVNFIIGLIDGLFSSYKNYEYAIGIFTDIDIEYVFESNECEYESGMMKKLIIKILNMNNLVSWE